LFLNRELSLFLFGRFFGGLFFGFTAAAAAFFGDLLFFDWHFFLL